MRGGPSEEWPKSGVAQVRGGPSQGWPKSGVAQVRGGLSKGYSSYSSAIFKVNCLVILGTLH